MHEYFAKSLVIAVTLLLTTSVLVGCEKPTVGVSVHGVNYAGDEFRYALVDPDNPKSIAASEEINAFSGGGTTCCYPLPTHWRPGIQIKIKTRHWLPKNKDGNLPEVNEEHVAEVPKYIDAKPGELWVLRAKDGSVSVISSDFQPDHEHWPGKVKGWPVPSLEYRRQRWSLVRDHQQGNVDLYVSLLNDLETDPLKIVTEAWDYEKQRDQSSLAKFDGPQDPKYLQHLKTHYQKSLEECRQELHRIEENRP